MGNYCLKRMREYTFLLLTRIDVDGFIMQVPEVLGHFYMSCLMLLVNTISILWGLWKVVSPWCKGRQLLGEAILKCALRQPVPGWQCVWKDLSRSPGWISPPITWDITPEQASDPGKLTCHLTEGCFAYPSENLHLLALHWGLAWACQATAQHSQSG